MGQSRESRDIYDLFEFFLQKKRNQVIEPSRLKKIMRLTQLETPKKRGGKERGSLRIKSHDFFLLLIKNNSVAIKICSLVEDGVYIVIASVEENSTKNFFYMIFYFSYHFSCYQLPP